MVPLLLATGYRSTTTYYYYSTSTGTVLVESGSAAGAAAVVCCSVHCAVQISLNQQPQCCSSAIITRYHAANQNAVFLVCVPLARPVSRSLLVSIRRLFSIGFRSPIKVFSSVHLAPFPPHPSTPCPRFGSWDLVLGKKWQKKQKNSTQLSSIM